ncbi:hypothetical protein O0L34_g1877 [Tuta absoluta]|nr:hypothetical protein O0L34_g1877 [Tuta absoluta]
MLIDWSGSTLRVRKYQLKLLYVTAEPASTIYAGTSDEVARICEFASFGEQDMTLRKYHEALRESNSSASSQLTADEMVEDALELISQDGDYMERIGMDDVRMQCILCAWAGSKFNLEYHIRKEHATEITRQDKNEWNITYKLGSLVNQLQWLSHACERDSTIYIVSVKYEDPDCLMASFSTITSMSEPEPKMGTLTLYNKVTGEPFTWHGQIMELNRKMPFENDPLHCLKIELSKLELLPNSANIKLHNRSLVLNSPSKVVVGQPALNDIHIIIFVKLHDLEFE